MRLSFLLQILPLEFMQYSFMRTALVATLLVAPLFALLGTMAVNQKMAFFSDALGHSAFTGIALGVLLGLESPVFSMLGFGIAMGLFITYVKNKNTVSTDTVISVFSSTAAALGIVILSQNGSFSSFSAYLIGDILTVGQKEVWVLGLLLVACYIVWGLIYNKLLFLNIHAGLSASRTTGTRLAENIFVAMLAVVVMVCVKWIGILTINSLLILPAAAARNICVNCRQYHFITLGISVFSSVGGLLAAYYTDTAAGAMMVLFSAVIFFITLLKKA